MTTTDTPGSAVEVVYAYGSADSSATGTTNLIGFPPAAYRIQWVSSPYLTTVSNDFLVPVRAPIEPLDTTERKPLHMLPPSEWFSALVPEIDED